MRTLIALILTSAAFAQVSQNGSRTFLGVVDAGGATSTKPSKSGTSLPGACGVGETYIKTDATSTNQLYICTATNTWTAQGGGSSGAGNARASWALCLGVPCTAATDQSNWYLITSTIAFSTCSVSAKTAPVGASLSFDILENGTTSIYGGSTKPTLATTVTGPSAFPISSPVSLTAGDYLTISITSIGSSVPGLDVSVVCTGS